MVDLTDRVAFARGERPADLILKNLKLVNVFTGEIHETEIVIVGEYIAAVGQGYKAKEVIDLSGRYVCPGFIDPHVHIESAMVPPREFPKAVLPHGVTSVVADPHEIANVLGLEGIRFMLQDAKHGPINIYITAPSCVPSTSMETSGAQLEFYDLANLLSDPWVLGLGEVMNYPGVVAGDGRILQKIQAYSGKVIDGHCPGLTGKGLNAYVSAGVMSDHECTNMDEALEKLRLGMTIFIREATNAHNLQALLGLAVPELDRRLCWCTDDRHPNDLLEEGSIDHIIRMAIAGGVDPVVAIRMGTLNPSQYYHLHELGAIAPGRKADMVVFSDLHNLRSEMVYRNGRLVAKDGFMLPWERPEKKTKTRGTINVRWSKLDFSIADPHSPVRVIGMIPDQLITTQLHERLPVVDGFLASSIEKDIVKLAVVERHFGTGRIGLGFVKGLGLKRGAIASSVAHDHHNIIVAGVDDESMITAVQTIVNHQGGMVAVDGSTVLEALPLPIAGLMSDQPIESVRDNLNRLSAAAHELGTPGDPFMALSFLALPVIPSLKLTDLGLVDVDRFEIVGLY